MEGVGQQPETALPSDLGNHPPHKGAVSGSADIKTPGVEPEFAGLRILRVQTLSSTGHGLMLSGQVLQQRDWFTLLLQEAGQESTLMNVTTKTQSSTLSLH